MSKTLNVVSLFSGCGGLDLGLELANNPKLKFETIWSNDFNDNACATHDKNFSNKAVHGDIWDIDVNDIPASNIVIGGFPCEEFSVLRGDRPGFKTKRGLLYTKFVEIVAKNKPYAFIAENVKGLLSVANGSAIKKIKKDFEKVDHVGYNVNYKLIKFADFGVPQKRERVIIIGIRNDLGFTFNFPKETHIGKHVSVKEAFTKPTLVEKIKLNNEKLKIQQSTIKKLNLIPPGGNYKDLPDHKDRNWMSLIYRRLHPDKPSPTIVAKGGGGTWGYHYAEPRPLTNRERARIQSFPDNFEFCGSTTEVRIQLGDAVPPMGIKPIAESLLKQLEDKI